MHTSEGFPQVEENLSLHEVQKKIVFVYIRNWVDEAILVSTNNIIFNEKNKET